MIIRTSGGMDCPRVDEINGAGDVLLWAGGRRGSRASLLAGASLAALAGFVAPDQALAACSDLPQTYSTPTTGPVFSNGGPITVTGTGSVTGISGSDGVDALNCPITTLTNESGGRIGGGNGAFSTNHGGAGGAGVSNASTITTLANMGAIGGGNGGDSFFGVGGTAGFGVTSVGAITTLSKIAARSAAGLAARASSAPLAARACRTPGRSGLCPIAAPSKGEPAAEAAA